MASSGSRKLQRQATRDQVQALAVLETQHQDVIVDHFIMVEGQLDEMRGCIEQQRHEVMAVQSRFEEVVSQLALLIDGTISMKELGNRREKRVNEVSEDVMRFSESMDKLKSEFERCDFATKKSLDSLTFVFARLNPQIQDLHSVTDRIHSELDDLKNDLKPILDSGVLTRLMENASEQSSEDGMMSVFRTQKSNTVKKGITGIFKKSPATSPARSVSPSKSFPSSPLPFVSRTNS